LQEALQTATRHAVKQFEKQLNTDVEAFDRALSEAVNQTLKEA
jgi:predicted outer membrane protein